MTLTEIATQVVNTIEMTDATSLARAKTFCRTRAKMIWRGHDWYVSKKLHTQSVTGLDSVGVDTGLVEIDDATLDYIIAATWNDIELVGMDHSTLLRLDTNAFGQVGQPAFWTPEPRSGSDKPQIRLSEFPSQTKTLLVLAKKLAPELADGDQLYQINGIEDALLAYVEGDMRKRDSQRAEANVLYAEGHAFIKAALAAQHRQMGQTTRLVPEAYGFVEDFESWISK